MEPELKVKIYLNKLGAQRMSAEQHVACMEERVAVANKAFIRGMECINVVKREVEEMRKTWETVSKQVTELEDGKTMEERLKEDFPIDDVEIEGETLRNEEGETGTGEKNRDGGEKEEASAEVKIETVGKT